MANKISAIVPCYNVEMYIERCLDSILHQTIGVENLQIILVDDASTDGTLNKLMHYEKMYPEYITVVPCKENHRQGAARNIGFSLATGDYISFIDADDWLEPDMYMSMYQNAVKYDCDAVVCKFLRDEGNGQVKRHPENNYLMQLSTNQEISDNIVKRELGEGIIIRLCRREFLENNDIYFPEDVCYEDAFWVDLFYVYVRRVYVMDEELYHYFVNPGSTVMQRNVERHLELLDVGLLLWQEYQERGLLSLYGVALEYDFIRVFYFLGIKMLAQRFDSPSYDVFCYMQDKLQELVPAWQDNYYINNWLSPFFQRLLKFSKMKLSEKDFMELMNMIDESSL